ncbi:YvcK family protein [Candidatus Falkowbacteria bacterium]|nr:YvcK family protein [Candidatus Falkowbacteria bacterium]
MKKQKIVTIGGGTGSFTVLSGLKYYPVELSAIVSMADDGGSTGVLRDELGVLPPGDVRQCLVALSESRKTLLELFNYRYSHGGLSGHSFGNIFLSTLEKMTGDFGKAVKEAGMILRIQGQVIPVTLADTKLVAELKGGKVIAGQYKIEQAHPNDIKKLWLSPRAKANAEAIKAIRRADKIVINPGNLFLSIIPNLLVSGVAKAIRESRGQKIYVANLMSSLGLTDNFTVMDHVEVLDQYLGRNTIDAIVYNTQRPSAEQLRKYSREGEHMVELGELPKNSRLKLVGDNLIARRVYRRPNGDKVHRTLIRHDSDKIAKIIFAL